MSSSATWSGSREPGGRLGVPSDLLSLRRVHVGSLNASKIQGVRDALAPFVPGLEVAGVEVESGVSEQPVGFNEILQGAKNRASVALARGGCGLAIGIEDGLVTLSGVAGIPDLPSPTLNIGCAWLTDGERESFGVSSGFGYPDDCAKIAQSERTPIGGLFDELWQARDSDLPDASPKGSGIGNIGKLTLGVLTRAEYVRHAVVCGFVRYLHPELYFVEAIEAVEAGEQDPSDDRDALRGEDLGLDRRGQLPGTGVGG